MLREFQEEIMRLRAALAEGEERSKGSTTTVMIDGRPVVVPLASAPPVKEFVDRIVEVEKIKVVGVSEEAVRALQERAEHERAELLARAASEQAAILQRVSHTEEERRRLEIEMERKAQEHEHAMREKEALQVFKQDMQGHSKEALREISNCMLCIA